MKKIFSSLVLLLIGLCCCSQAVQADDAPNFSNAGTGCTMRKVEIPSQKFTHENLELFATIRREDHQYDNFFRTLLTEDQANNADSPINVSLNNNIQILLQGEESYSSVYCSGAGSEHGYRWEYDNSAQSDVLSEPCFTGDLMNHGLINPNSSHSGWTTQPVSFNWSFNAQQVGTVTLTFKKYYYSNAMIRNLDGSSPWKDPVETIQFTINVIDDTVAQ